MSHKKIFPGEEINDLLRNGLSIIQSSELPKFNTDSILLANFPKVKNGWKVCDLCTGTGIIPLVLTTRARELKISAVELNNLMRDMAKRSIELNNLENQIEVLHEDVRHTSLSKGTFDLVTVNPPYFTPQWGPISKEVTRAQARSQVELTLQEVVHTGYSLLKEKGTFAIVYNSSGVADLLSLLSSQKLSVARIRFIHHNIYTKSSSCLLEAQKGAKHRMVVEHPLIIYQENGNFTPELQGLYYEGKSLESRAY
jgi:tRNA1Val (adenine37-N6)-methyltransferase